MISKPFRSETGLGSSFSFKESLVDLKDSMDSAGQATMDLIGRAATVAKDNNHQALNALQEMSVQLETANLRIKELEGQVSHYRIRAERAERWFETISTEIQRQFHEVLAKQQPEQPQQPRPSSSSSHFRIASTG